MLPLPKATLIVVSHSCYTGESAIDLTIRGKTVGYFATLRVSGLHGNDSG